MPKYSHTQVKKFGEEIFSFMIHNLFVTWFQRKKHQYDGIYTQMKHFSNGMTQRKSGIVLGYLTGF